MKIKFEIPREPMSSPRPRFTMRGNYPVAYMPKKYEAEKAIISDLFANDFGTEFATYDGTLKVKVDFKMPFPKTSYMGFNGAKAQVAKELKAEEYHDNKPDLDNLIKTYLDALNGMAWVDDSQIVELELKKSWSFTPSVIMTIDYLDIKNKKELETFYDVKQMSFIEMVDKIWKERKNKK